MGMRICLTAGHVKNVAALELHGGGGAEALDPADVAVVVGRLLQPGRRGSSAVGVEAKEAARSGGRVIGALCADTPARVPAAVVHAQARARCLRAAFRLGTHVLNRCSAPRRGRGGPSTSASPALGPGTPPRSSAGSAGSSGGEHGDVDGHRVAAEAALERPEVLCVGLARVGAEVEGEGAAARAEGVLALGAAHAEGVAVHDCRGGQEAAPVVCEAKAQKRGKRVRVSRDEQVRAAPFSKPSPYGFFPATPAAGPGAACCKRSIVFSQSGFGHATCAGAWSHRIQEDSRHDASSPPPPSSPCLRSPQGSTRAAPLRGAPSSTRQAQREGPSAGAPSGTEVARGT